MALVERQSKSRGVSETTLAHFYRAEVSRSTAWRNRLDTTTNWAITTAAAVLSLSFSSTSTPHATVLVGLVLVCVFLGIESRRYRYYDLWARRVRLVETAYLVPLLRREEATDDFNAALASELSRPRLRISLLDSLCFRFVRTYSAIIALMLFGWVVKLDIHPNAADSFAELYQRARIGPAPAFLVWIGWLATVTVFVWLWWRGRSAPLPSTELQSAARRRTRALGPAVQRLFDRETRRVREFTRH